MTRYHVCSTPGCPNLEPCPVHARPRNARWSHGRSGKLQHRFHKAIRRRCGGVCERCHAAPMTVAHHVRDGWTPDCGLGLCDDCHLAVDNHARRTR